MTDDHALLSAISGWPEPILWPTSMEVAMAQPIMGMNERECICMVMAEALKAVSLIFPASAWKIVQQVISSMNCIPLGRPKRMIRANNRKSGRAPLSVEYFSRYSGLRKKYRNIKVPQAAEMTVAHPAPATPIWGKPNFPKIRA